MCLIPTSRCECSKRLQESRLSLCEDFFKNLVTVHYNIPNVMTSFHIWFVAGGNLLNVVGGYIIVNLDNQPWLLSVDSS